MAKIPDWLYQTIDQPRSLEQIVLSLSRIHRYCGNSPRAYSVAKHSVVVLMLLPHGCSFEAKKLALLHDAHEAFTSDIPKPVKQVIGQPLQDLTDTLDQVLFQRFDLHPKPLDIAAVAEADALAARIEIDTLGLSFAQQIKYTLGMYAVPAFEHDPNRRPMIAGLLQSSSLPDADLRLWQLHWNKIWHRECRTQLRKKNAHDERSQNRDAN